MKNVTKIIATGSFLALLLASIVTSTYAWFRSIKTAVVYANNLTIYSNQGNLKMAYVAKEFGGVESISGDNTPELSVNASSGSATDISGNGVNLYRPNWKPSKDGSEASSIRKISNTSSNQYFINFGIKFENDGSGSYDICLSSNQTYVQKSDDNTSSVQAAKSTRISISDSEDNIKCLWQYDNSDASYKYIKEQEGGDAYGASGYTLADPSTDYPTSFHTGGFTTINSSGDTQSAGQNIITVPAHSSETINVAIWIEGTLESATNACVGGRVSVNMKFVAI